MMRSFKRGLSIVITLIVFLPCVNLAVCGEEITQQGETLRMVQAAEQNGIIVKYKKGVNSPERLPFSNNDKIDHFSIEDGVVLDGAPAKLVKVESKDMKTVLDELNNDPAIEYAEPNYKVSLNNDPNYPLQWGLKNSGQKIGNIYGTSGVDINIEPARNITKGDPSVTVAVIDTGVDISHPELYPSVFRNGAEKSNGADTDGNGYIDDLNGWDFANDDNTVYDGSLDSSGSNEDSHGTHVAGIIAASINGKGIEGVAPDVRILPLKFINGADGGYVFDAVRAIQYAEKMGAAIANCSWGSYGYSYALAETIAQSNILFVCSAGNESVDISTRPNYPAALSAIYRNVISVSSIDNRNRISSFSNYSADVEAPGDLIYSTLPNGKYGYMSGTSMASPHVAGIAALVKSNKPSLQRDQIKSRITGSIIPVGSSMRSNGRVDAYAALTHEMLEPSSSEAIYGAKQVQMDDSIYRFGGYGETGYQDGICKYDGTAGDWKPCSYVPVNDFLGLHFGAAPVDNGIFLFGGARDDVIHDDVYLMKKDENLFKQEPMPKPLCAMGVAVIGNIIYVFGGVDENGYTDTVYQYNHSTSTWTQLGIMPFKGAYMCASVVNGKIYITGGSTADGCLNSNYEYNPGTDKWTEKTPMTVNRNNHQALAKDGQVYVFGGDSSYSADGKDEAAAPQANDSIDVRFYNDSVEAYDPIYDTWTVLDSMDVGRVGFTIMPFDDELYFSGGYDGSNFVMNSELYTGTTYPKNASVLTMENDSMKIFWNHVKNAAGYELKINDEVINADATEYVYHTASEEIYTIKVRAKYENGNSSSWCSPIYKTPHDSLRDAKAIALNATTTDQLTVPNQKKWYKISPEVLGDFHFQIGSLPEGCNLQASLYDAAGEVIVAGKQDGGEIKVDKIMLDRYDYYIKVSLDGKGSDEPFSLTAVFEEDGDQVPARIKACAIRQTNFDFDPDDPQEGLPSFIPVEGRVTLNETPEDDAPDITLDKYDKDPSKPGTELSTTQINEIRDRDGGFLHLGNQQLNTTELSNKRRGKVYFADLKQGDKVTCIVKPDKGIFGVNFANYATGNELGNGTWVNYNDGVGYCEYSIPADNWYQILVYPRSDAPGNEFEFSLYLSGHTDSYEPNFFFNAASSIAGKAGNRLTAATPINNLAIDSPKDEDYYKIHLDEGDKISAVLSMKPGYNDDLQKHRFCLKYITSENTNAFDSAWTDYYYNVFEFDNVFYSKDYDAASPNGMDKYLSMHAPQTGDYYLTVMSKTGKWGYADKNKYDLRLTTVKRAEMENDEYERYDSLNPKATNDFFEVNARTNSIPELDFNVSKNGAIDNELDVDWFKLKPHTSSRITAYLEPEDIQTGDGFSLVICDKNGSGIRPFSTAASYPVSAGQEYYLGIYTKNYAKIKGKSSYKIRVSASESYELNFRKAKGKTYIYENNHEHIRMENVVNVPFDDPADGNKSWLMSLRDLPAGDYVIFSSHKNTTYLNHNYDAENARTGGGCPIKLDTRITRKNSATQVQVTQAGYWTGLEGVEISWSGLSAFADFEGKAITELPIPAGKRDDSFGNNLLQKPSTPYDSTSLNPTPVAFEDHIGWLGDYFPRVREETALGQPVVFVQAITVSDGSIDLDIGAFATENGYTSREIAEGTTPGKLVPDDEFKGVSYNEPRVTASLSYVITDPELQYMTLPVQVYNDETGSGGRLCTDFFANYTSTHLFGNSAQDVDRKKRVAESDMLEFIYEDGSPGSPYRFGPNIPFTNAGGESVYNYGNYGVKTEYTITINNTTAKPKKFVYFMGTGCNYVASIERISGGIPVQNGQLRAHNDSQLEKNKKLNGTYIRNMAECELPAFTKTTFKLTVMNTTNTAAGITNEFAVFDSKYDFEDKQDIATDSVESYIQEKEIQNKEGE